MSSTSTLYLFKELSAERQADLKFLFLVAYDNLRHRWFNQPTDGGGGGGGGLPVLENYSVPLTLEWLKLNFPLHFGDVDLSRQTCSFWLKAHEQAALRKHLEDAADDGVNEAALSAKRKRGPKVRDPATVGFVDRDKKCHFVSLAVRQMAADAIMSQHKAKVPVSVPLSSRLVEATFQFNGVQWTPCRSWQCSFLHEIGLTPRRITRQHRKLPSNFNIVGTMFVLRVFSMIRQYNIDPDFLLNFDETGLLLFYISAMTWADKGAKQVDGRMHEEKRQKTVIPCLSFSGNVCGCVVVWGGKTRATCPSKTVNQQYPNVVHDFSTTHWSTPEVVERFIDHLYQSYILPKMLKKGKRPAEAYWLLLLDVYSSHIDSDMLARVRVKYPTLIILFVPASCTPKLQPCDVRFNAWFKWVIRDFMGVFMQEEMLRQMRQGVKPTEIVIETDLSKLKPVFTGAVSSACTSAPPDLVSKSFKACGVEGTSFLMQYFYEEDCTTPEQKYHHEVLKQCLVSMQDQIWLPISAPHKQKYANCIGGGGSVFNVLSWPKGLPTANDSLAECSDVQYIMDATAEEEDEESNVE